MSKQENIFPRDMERMHPEDCCPNCHHYISFDDNKKPVHIKVVNGYVYLRWTCPCGCKNPQFPEGFWDEKVKGRG